MIDWQTVERRAKAARGWRNPTGTWRVAGWVVLSAAALWIGSRIVEGVLR